MELLQKKRETYNHQCFIPNHLCRAFIMFGEARLYQFNDGIKHDLKEKKVIMKVKLNVESHYLRNVFYIFVHLSKSNVERLLHI